MCVVLCILYVCVCVCECMGVLISFCPCLCLSCDLYYFCLYWTTTCINLDKNNHNLHNLLFPLAQRQYVVYFLKYNFKNFEKSKILGPPSAADPYGTNTFTGLSNGASAAAAAYGAAQTLNASALQAAAATVAGKQIEGKWTYSECFIMWMEHK